MKRTIAVFLGAVLLASALHGQTSSTSTPAGQSPVPPAPSAQPATPANLDDLSPEQQAWLREIGVRLKKAIAEKDTAALDQIAKEAEDHLKQIGATDPPLKYTYQQPAPTVNAQAPKAQPQQSGCVSEPVKKPRFHLPKKIQDAINKQTRQIGDKTGIDLDPNAPAQTIKDAQNKPCAPNPTPNPKPANQ
jgi:hypothetical protein